MASQLGAVFSLPLLLALCRDRQQRHPIAAGVFYASCHVEQQYRDTDPANVDFGGAREFIERNGRRTQKALDKRDRRFFAEVVGALPRFFEFPSLSRAVFAPGRRRATVARPTAAPALRRGLR